MTWSEFFKWLMDHEGRVVHNDPDDPGGQTAWGISRRHNPNWHGWMIIDAGGRDIGTAVSQFYYVTYQPLWEALPPRVREAVVDAVVNMGPGRKGDDLLGGIELLQESINRLRRDTILTVDGSFGPRTRAAVKTVDASALAFTVCALRLADYGLRGKQGKVARKYLDGWINRVRSLMEKI